LSKLILSPFLIKKNHSDLINRIDNSFISRSHLGWIQQTFFNSASAIHEFLPFFKQRSTFCKQQKIIRCGRDYQKMFPKQLMSNFKPTASHRIWADGYSVWSEHEQYVADRRILKLAWTVCCSPHAPSSGIKKEKDGRDSTKTALLKKKTLTCETAQFHQENGIAKNKKRSSIKQEIKRNPSTR
jgi:hypothetical protein